MSKTEWLRSFLSVYRAGSVTDAAAHRGVSQPAVSQHIAALERSAGERLFVRTSRGVEPTQRGRELYAQVTAPLDALEDLLATLGHDRGPAPGPPVRVGTSPEYFAAQVLPRLVGAGSAVTATFGDEPTLFALLGRGELDLALTSATPPRRALRAVPLGAQRFVLVVAPSGAPASPLGSLPELARWLPGRPWTSYSLELPVTRRFWQAVLGQPFTAQPVLVVPDLRAVLRAVELGLGVSLLPHFVCAEALASGRVVEPYPVSDLVPHQPWFLTTRLGETPRPAVHALAARLGAPPSA